MDNKLQHMHDRMNYLAATLDAFDPQEVKDQIDNFAELTQGRAHAQIADALWRFSQKVDLLGRRIAKKRSKGQIKRDERTKMAKKATRAKK